MYERAVLLTKEGLARLEAELHELRTVRRPQVAREIREAQELGPDQLDGQYEDAKNQQAFLEGRIGEIERMLERAEIIDEQAAHKSKEIRVGSTVGKKLGKQFPDSMATKKQDAPQMRSWPKYSFHR